MEEVGINILDFQLFDADSVSFEWQYKEDIIKVHHTGIFFKINNYDGNIKRNIKIDKINDDLLGADFYEIENLNRNNLSEIVVIELEKMGYVLK